jgi:hypothetical protein
VRTTLAPFPVLCLADTEHGADQDQIVLRRGIRPVREGNRGEQNRLTRTRTEEEDGVRFREDYARAFPRPLLRSLLAAQRARPKYGMDERVRLDSRGKIEGDYEESMSMSVSGKLNFLRTTTSQQEL